MDQSLDLTSTMDHRGDEDSWFSDKARLIHPIHLSENETEDLLSSTEVTTGSLPLTIEVLLDSVRSVKLKILPSVSSFLYTYNSYRIYMLLARSLPCDI